MKDAVLSVVKGVVLSSIKAGVLSSIKAGVLSSIKAGVLSSIKAGVLSSIKAGVLSAIKAGVLSSNPDVVDLLSALKDFTVVSCLKDNFIKLSLTNILEYLKTYILDISSLYANSTIGPPGL